MKKLFVLAVLCSGMFAHAMQEGIYQSLPGLPEVQAIEMDELSVFSEENRTLLQNYSAEMVTSALSALAQDADYQVLLSSQKNSARANSGSNRQRAERECIVKLLAKLVQQKKSENDGRREELENCGLKEYLMFCGLLPSTAGIMGMVLAVVGLLLPMMRAPECPH